jgi:hypothetical protein
MRKIEILHVQYVLSNLIYYIVVISNAKTAEQTDTTHITTYVNTYSFYQQNNVLTSLHNFHS